MMNIPGFEMLAAFQKQLRDVFLRSGLDVQLFLCVLAIAVAMLLSMLIQRLLQRKLPQMSKEGWVTTKLVPAVLSPILVIMMLVIANEIADSLVAIRPHIIAGLIKIALVWLLARILLLIAHRHFMAYLISVVMLILTLLSVTGLLAPTQAALNDIAFETSTFRLSLLGAIKGTFTLIVLFWSASVLSKSAESWLRNLQMSFNARELSAKFIRLGLYLLAFILTLNEMGVNLTALTVFGGALAVGIGFGLQKITSNFISGIILLFEKTIQAGDLIEVGGEKGWVRQMAIRHTVIETPDGREMLIPNEDLIIGKVTNWTYTNTRARIEIILTVVYGSDVEQVKELLLAAAKAYPRSITDPAPACLLREFNTLGLQFQLIFWIADVHEGMAIAKSDVMFRIVRAFKEYNVTFAVAT